MSIGVSNKTIEKYFGFLLKLDNKSKKKLIVKLTESIGEKDKSKINLKNLSGAWEDSRDSDEIIREIRASRINKKDDIDF